MFAAIRGLERRSYDAFALIDLLPGGEARSHFLRRQIPQWFAILVRHQDQNNAKVTQMAVAYEAVKNFVVGLLLFALLAGVYSVVTPPNDELVNRLKTDQLLRDMLRGPQGPPGPMGPIGPSAPGGIPDPSSASGKTP